MMNALKSAALAAAVVSAPNVGSQEAPRDWWQDRVWYEVFVRSFADSTEGPLANDGVGDIRGLIERLDYLNDGDPKTDHDLGITGIWLMPINQSPSYHGYDVVDYRSVDDEYGKIEDMKELVAECHKRGIAVIIDLVINHTSSEHPWFKAAASDEDNPKHDWFVWSSQQPDWLGPWGQKAWHGQARQAIGKWYYGVFWHGMPDLNWRNPAVEQEVIDFSRWWLDEIGIDGFRLDAVKLLIAESPSEQENTDSTIDALARYNLALSSSHPQKFMVGEVWENTKNVRKYLVERERVGAAAMDSAFEFDIAFAVVGGIKEGKAGRISDAITRAYEAHPNQRFSTFLTNHDQSRIRDEFAGDPEKLKLAATLLLTMPGTPFLYYGEEIGMRGSKPDPDIRRPMQWSNAAFGGFSGVEPWSPHWEDVETVNVDRQSSDPESLLSLYRDLIDLRSADPAIGRGGYGAVQTGTEDVLAFVRTDPVASRSVLVLANVTSNPVKSYMLRGRGLGVPSRAQATNLMTGEKLDSVGVNQRGSLSGYKPLRELAPETAYIIELSPPLD